VIAEQADLGGRPPLGAMPRALSVRGPGVKRAVSGMIGSNGGRGGACAQLVVRVGCARAPSFISVHAPRIPKRRNSINAEDGFVFLRGVVDRPEDIERTGAATRQIPGVREVENLIHLPGTPPPASRPKSERVRSSDRSP
jgi:hypothetical protein